MVTIMQYCFLKCLRQGFPDQRHATSGHLLPFTCGPSAALRQVPSSALYISMSETLTTFSRALKTGQRREPQRGFKEAEGFKEAATGGETRPTGEQGPGLLWTELAPSPGPLVLNNSGV